MIMTFRNKVQPEGKDINTILLLRTIYDNVGFEL